MYGTGLCLDSEEKLLEYLAFLKGRHDDPKSEEEPGFSGIYDPSGAGKEDHCSHVSGR